MDQKKLKIKYLLNLWKALPSYPTQEDVLFEISSYLEKDGRANGEFSEKTLEFVFRNSSTEELIEIHSLMETLKRNGDIIETKETGDGKKWWSIKNNIA